MSCMGILLSEPPVLLGGFLYDAGVEVVVFQVVGGDRLSIRTYPDHIADMRDILLLQLCFFLLVPPAHLSFALTKLNRCAITVEEKSGVDSRSVLLIVGHEHYRCGGVGKRAVNPPEGMRVKLYGFPFAGI